jgi:hypothetical protein
VDAGERAHALAREGAWDRQREADERRQHAPPLSRVVHSGDCVAALAVRGLGQSGPLGVFGASHDAAEPALCRSLVLAPFEPHPRANLAAIHDARKELPEALAEYEILTGISPDAATCNQLRKIAPEKMSESGIAQ